MKKKRIPQVGEILPAFDDGKIRLSRLYFAEIIEVITFNDAKTINVCDADGNSINLIDAWEAEKKDIYWLFADDTDYFVRAKVKGDIYEDQWFARTKDGGWFSMGYIDRMIGARLDSDMELFDSWSDPSHPDYETYWELKDMFIIKNEEN